MYFDQPLLLDSLKEVDKMKYQEFQIYFYIRAQYSIGASKQKTENLAHIHVHTVYGKTFKGENFCGFLANCKSFPLESFAVYST